MVAQNLKAFDYLEREIISGAYRTPECNFLYFTGNSIHKGTQFEVIYLGKRDRKPQVGYVSRRDCAVLLPVPQTVLPRQCTEGDLLLALYALRKSEGKSIFRSALKYFSKPKRVPYNWDSLRPSHKEKESFSPGHLETDGRTWAGTPRWKPSRSHC